MWRTAVQSTHLPGSIILKPKTHRIRTRRTRFLELCSILTDYFWYDAHLHKLCLLAVESVNERAYRSGVHVPRIKITRSNGRNRKVKQIRLLLKRVALKGKQTESSNCREAGLIILFQKQQQSERAAAAAAVAALCKTNVNTRRRKQTRNCTKSYKLPTQRQTPRRVEVYKIRVRCDWTV